MANELQVKINLLVEKLMNLGGADYDSDKTTSENARKTGLVARDFGIEEWDWPQGVGLYGLNKLQLLLGQNQYMDFFKNWFEANIKKGLPSANINTTAPFLTLADILDKFQNADYEALCLKRAEWLMNELPKTKENGFEHVTTSIGNRNAFARHEEQLWIDTLFMAVLFLNKMGHKYNRKDWIEESIHQVLLHIKYLYDKKAGLFYHGWTFKENNNFGEVFWCRGNSWFTFGIVDFIEDFHGDMDAGLRRYLEDTFKAQVNSLLALQGDSGLWHTVLDDETSYGEVSGTAAIATGILKGIKLGILDASCKIKADKAIEAICRNIGSDGTVLNVSAGTGIGMDKGHYKNIMIAPMAYGQSLALVALCEALEQSFK